MRKKFRKHLIKLAKTSDNAGGSKHSCIITRGNKILASGVNSEKTNPFLTQFPLIPKWTHYSVHAEIAAINDFVSRNPYKKLRKCELLVVRVLDNGEMSLSKPCEVCQTVLDKLSVKKVKYSK